MKRIPTIYLCLGAAVGGMVTVTFIRFYRHRMHAKFVQQPFYHKTIDIFYGYKPGIELLKEPVKVMKPDMLDNISNRTDGKTASVKTKVYGSSKTAFLYSYASRQGVHDEWNVDKCDLEVGETRWTFYENPNFPTKEVPQARTDLAYV